MKSEASRKIRYAVVGVGNIAQVAVLPAFKHASENSELVALVSSDPLKRAELSKQYRLDVTGDYEDLEHVLERARVDAVYLAVPNTMHRELTERAAKAKRHVLCEKPMAASVADCEAMIRACDEHQVKLMIAYRLHFEEANLRAIELVKAGEIGAPRLFTASFTQQVRRDDIRTQSELGGGALYDMGIYCINAARYIFRDEPEEVFATTLAGDDRFDGVDETSCAILRFSGGRIAQISASLGSAPVSSYRVIGTHGDLRVEPAFEYTTALKHYLTVGGRTHERSFAKRDQFAPELVMFSRAVLSDVSPEPSGLEGLADVRIMQAILHSAQKRQAVHLPPFTRDRRPGIAQEMHKPPVREPRTIHAPSPSID